MRTERQIRKMGMSDRQMEDSANSFLAQASQQRQMDATGVLAAQPTNRRVVAIDPTFRARQWNRILWNALVCGRITAGEFRAKMRKLGFSEKLIDDDIENAE